uniref:Uncharacterized protein n=2 Tax=Diacronema lutheri TaxID=2081491 RepID=A0A7R9UWQ7_DIALT
MFRGRPCRDTEGGCFACASRGGDHSALAAMNTREMLSWSELLDKEKKIRRSWQAQEQNWRGIYKAYSAQSRQLQDLQELVGELVDPSEVFRLVKKPDECKLELRAALLRAIEMADAELRALKAPPALG